MPKLTDALIFEKLREQLADLKAGKEVEARKMKTILSDAQLKQIDDKWNEQQKLRAKVKARTKQQQIDAGYKSKREVQIEVYEEAVKEQNPLTILQKEMRKADVRRAKIFMDSYGNARKNGKDKLSSCLVVWAYRWLVTSSSTPCHKKAKNKKMQVAGDEFKCATRAQEASLRGEFRV